MPSVYDFEAQQINGQTVPLKQFEGKVLLILDVPAARVEEVEGMIAKSHPELSFGGMEPPMLACP
jgi:hypothetical protein